MTTKSVNNSILISNFIVLVVLIRLCINNNYGIIDTTGHDFFPLLNFLPNFFLTIFTDILLPLLVFFLIQLLFLKYLSFIWATAISVVATFSYVGYEFKNFLIDVLFNWQGLKVLEGKSLFLIDYPNVSLAVIIFLLLAHLSIKITKFDFVQIFLLTFLWSLFSIYSLSGSLIGVIFWFFYFTVKLYRTKKYQNKKIFINIVSNIFLFFVVIFFLKNYINFNNLKLENLIIIDLKYFIFYFVLPIILILTIFYFYKIDRFEIVVKFLHIYILMLSDFIVTLVFLNFDKNFVNHEFFIYPHFVLHFYYFMPIIYYLSRPSNPFDKNKQSKGSNLKKKVSYFFNELSIIYLPVLFVMIAIYTFLPGIFLL